MLSLYSIWSITCQGKRKNFENFHNYYKCVNDAADKYIRILIKKKPSKPGSILSKYDLRNRFTQIFQMLYVKIVLVY